MSDREAIRRALAALLEARILSARWDPKPFIRMDVGRPDGQRGPELLYESPTITAAYAAKAAAAARRLLHPSALSDERASRAHPSLGVADRDLPERPTVALPLAVAQEADRGS